MKPIIFVIGFIAIGFIVLAVASFAGWFEVMLIWGILVSLFAGWVNSL